ncbi:MAG: hypothetical protein DCC67_12955 [Planctomycetota bacterium]|nr:MAG: hypothetical protein DCC67_12955 [Planctomycetota bacterium]
MTEELLAYLLDDLSPQRRAVVERRIEIDPAWRRELERLQQCLAAGGDPQQCGCEDVAPPEDLLTRTCFLVEQACCCQEDQPKNTLDPARTPAAGARPLGGKRLSPERCTGELARPWTLWDVSIGAGVLLALAALMSPALYETRAAARRLTCDDKLKTLGTALYDYQANHAKQLPPVLPGQNAAMFAVSLRDGAGLTEEALAQLLVCPESPLAIAVSAGRVRFDLPDRREIENASPQRLDALMQRIACSYAYRVGYYDVEDQYQQLPYTGDPQMPLLSDAPQVTAAGVRAANHGPGQNVLYECLGVKYRTNYLAENRDHFYLNQAGRHAAGLGEEDVVLIHPQRTPFGEVLPIVNAE